MSAMPKHRRVSGNWMGYFLSRGSTFAFMGFLMAGLAMGSLFCIAGTESGALLRSIVESDLALQMGRSYPELFLSGISGFTAIFLFVYLCVNCTKGAMLVNLTPLVHGASLGAVITTILYGNGYGALPYIVVCIFLPKVLETFLLLSLCNKASRYCKEMGAGMARKGKESFPILLYLILFTVYFVLESLVLLFFRGLL